MSTKTCSVCHTKLECGAITNETQPCREAEGARQACWCADFPNIMPADFNQDCRCPTCLAKAIAKYIDNAINTQSREQLLKLAKPYRHDEKMIEYIDYTIENGNYIFTKWYHLKRGECCGNGCRYCPY